MQENIAVPHFSFSFGGWERWLWTPLRLVAESERFELCKPEGPNLENWSEHDNYYTMETVPNLEKWEVTNIIFILECPSYSLIFSI